MPTTVNSPQSKAETGNSKLETGPVSDFQFPVSRLSPSQLEFLAQVVPPALQSEREHGIPACITIAQAILESAARVQVTGGRGQATDPQSKIQNPKSKIEWRWGGSILYREANNPFGIKCTHVGAGLKPAPTAAVDSRVRGNDGAEDYTEFSVETHEVVHGKLEAQRAAFQRFPDLASAFRAHARLFLNLPRYRQAIAALRETGNLKLETGNSQSGPVSNFQFPVSMPSWQRFAVAIMNCGYSTDRPELCRQPGCPHYAGKLIKLVSQYRLHDPRALAWYATGQDPQSEVGSGIGNYEF